MKRTQIPKKRSVSAFQNWTEKYPVFSEKKEVEWQQGKNIVDACKKTGVGHLVLSTAAHLTDEKMGLPHVDIKTEIEKCKQINPDLYTMENYLKSAGWESRKLQ